MSFLPSSPGPTNLTEVMQQHPVRATLMLRLIDDIMRGDSPLSVAERELIFAYGSAQNACNFCYHSHRPVAAAFGIDEAVFDELMIGIDSASVDDRLKPILRYVQKLTLTPSRMTQADADAILAAGWDEQALVDVVSICAVQNFFNRFVDGVGVDVDDSTARQTGAAVLPTIGYAGLADRLEQGEGN
ncbi:MAG: peroxidase-related enzyme [Chromatiales bacterium]|nr:MAG: peroxidase-related enzyme [Chromatiales bacterium]